MKNSPFIHVKYHEILGLYLHRFGEDCTAYDVDHDEYLITEELEELYRHALTLIHDAECFGTSWNGGAYITEQAPVISSGVMYGVEVTMTPAALVPLPELRLFWHVDYPTKTLA